MPPPSIDAPDVSLSQQFRAGGLTVSISPKQLGQILVALVLGVLFIWYEQQSIKRELRDLGAKLDSVVEALQPNGTARW